MTVRDKQFLKTKFCCQNDLNDLVNIDRACFEDSWTRNTFRKLNAYNKNNPPRFLHLIQSDNRPIGYFFYELHEDYICLLRMAIIPLYQRQGIGKLVIQELISKLHEKRRTHLIIDVDEYNTGAQYFLKDMGLTCNYVFNNYYGDHDAYVFEYTI